MPTETHETDLSPGITEEAIAEARELNDVELRTTDEGVRRRHNWNKEATLDNFRHYARAYGGDNPLYTNPSYATDTRWDGLVAPPTWLFTVDTTIVAPKLAGLQWIYAGTKFEFHEPVYRGDEFTVTVRQTDVKRKSGRSVEEFLLQKGVIEYYNQHDELVATAEGRTTRVPRPNHADDKNPSADDASIAQHREPKHWSPQELSDLEDLILDQSRRGAETRYWDTVSEGDKIEPRIKGPLSVTDMICWYMGWGSPVYFSHELYIKERQAHPSEAFRRSDTGIYEHPAMGHLDPTVAVGIGVPRAYDVGQQRLAWAAHAVTDWMGDDGFLRSFDMRLNGMNYLGEVTYCRGTVTDVYMDEETDEHLVDLDLEGVTHHHKVQNMSGECTVRLPTSD